MPLYYLDPTREPRECLDCATDGAKWTCHWCNGTGRLGDPEARPEINVWDLGRSFYWQRVSWQNGKQHMRFTTDASPYPTEHAAVEAARAALKGGK